MSRASQGMMSFQLALPLPESSRQVPLPPEERRIAPPQLWATLDARWQTQLQQALLRVLQEVLHDAPRH